MHRAPPPARLHQLFLSQALKVRLGLEAEHGSLRQGLGEPGPRVAEDGEQLTVLPAVEAPLSAEPAHLDAQPAVQQPHKFRGQRLALLSRGRGAEEMTESQRERLVGEETDGGDGSEIAALGEVAQDAAADIEARRAIVEGVSRTSGAGPANEDARDPRSIAHIDADGVELVAESGLQGLGVGGGIEEQDASASGEEAAEVTRPGGAEGEMEALVGEKDKGPLRGKGSLAEGGDEEADLSEASEASEGSVLAVVTESKACGALQDGRSEEAIHVEALEVGEGVEREARGGEKLGEGGEVRVSVEGEEERSEEGPEGLAEVRKKGLLLVLPGGANGGVALAEGEPLNEGSDLVEDGEANRGRSVGGWVEGFEFVSEVA